MIGHGGLPILDIFCGLLIVNAGEKMHRRAGVKMHHGLRHSAATLNSVFQFDQ